MTPTDFATDSAAATGPVGLSGNWKLVFGDDFNGTAVDASKWATCLRDLQEPLGWAPSPDVWCERVDIASVHLTRNIVVSDGTVKLTAKKEYFYDPLMLGPETPAMGGPGYDYTSAILTTSGNRLQPPTITPTYGFIEARLKYPGKTGDWPNFWMIPDDNTWPPEINIGESTGNASTTMGQHYHYGCEAATCPPGWPGHTEWSTGVAGIDITDWHIYAVDWNPDCIGYYVDGKKTGQFSLKEFIYSLPMYIRLEHKLGGHGGDIDDSTLPSQLEADWVRIWERQ
jgi:beta-glucanase (GH16 family)